MSPKPDRPYLKGPVAASGPSREASSRPLSVLIVTYKSHDLVEKCLALVAQHLPGLPVYVYENTGEGYPGREELAARHPEVHWVLGAVNIGFAAAANALVETTPSDTDLLFLNPDARLLGPLTRTRELIHHPGVAAVSPMTRDDAGPGSQLWDVATRHRNLTRALVAWAGYADSLRGTPFSYLYAKQPTESDNIDGYISGACLAVSREAWDAIGGFDEEFFLYGEEADWQARAQAAGWRILLADELGIDHGGEPNDDASSTHGRPAGAGEGRRNYDLLRTNIALLLEHQSSVHHANLYLAGTTLMDRVQRSKRSVRQRTIARRRDDHPSIVITTNRMARGAAERQRALLAAELDRRGYPVTVVCLQRFGPLVKEIPHTVRVVRQPWWTPLIDVAPGPAVVISGDTKAETRFAMLWRAADARRRWLVAAHTLPNEDGRPTYSRSLAGAIRRADGVLVSSEKHWTTISSQNRLGDRYCVVPNGLSVDAARTGVVHAKDARGEGGPPHLVMLTRPNEQSPHLLLDALSGLLDLPWTLSIFGDGPSTEGSRSRTSAAMRDRIDRRPWPATPGEALANADLLCVPCPPEVFPVDVLDAMERGIPVAASAVGAVPEMLDFGRAGIVVDPPTVSQWRANLADVLSDPAVLPTIGASGFRHGVVQYTPEAMTDAYLNAISSVLGVGTALVSR